MSQIPLIFNFQYDYGVKLVFVDENDDMDMVARKAAFHSAGKLVKAPPNGAALRIRIQGKKKFLPRDATVKDVGLKKMECIQILVEGTPEYAESLRATEKVAAG